MIPLILTVIVAVLNVDSLQKTEFVWEKWFFFVGFNL